MAALTIQIVAPIASVIGYFLITELLLRYPLWYVKRNPKIAFKVTHSAHRGGCLLGPENTVHTFERAVKECGVDMIELDVRRSKDGEVIIAHDDTVERICEGRVDLVSEIHSSQLPFLKSEIALHFTSAKHQQYVCPKEQRAVDGTTGVRMSTLREAFERMPNTPMHIDIKDQDAVLVDKVVALVREFKREHLTILGAVLAANERQLKKLSKQHNLFLFSGLKSVVFAVILYYTRLLPFIPLQFDAFSIPLPTTAMRKRFVGYLGTNKKGCCSWKVGVIRSVLWLFRSFGLWNHLRRRGIVVVGWVLNDEEEWKEAYNWPIDGIMTDDPAGYYAFQQEQFGSSKRNKTHGSNNSNVTTSLISSPIPQQQRS